MAYEVPGLTISAEAAADLSTHQYKFVKITGANTCGLVTASTDRPAGVLQNKPGAAGRAATIQQDGISKVIAGAAVTAGAAVMADATARAITAATAGNVVVGIALTGASNAGEVLSVELTGPSVV